MSAPGPAGRALAGLVVVYQWTIGPVLTALFGTSCRFTPSCSEFAVVALREHGVGRGLQLTVRRLARCRPGGGYGHDPVPPRHEQHAQRTQRCTLTSPSTKAA